MRLSLAVVRGQGLRLLQKGSDKATLSIAPALSLCMTSTRDEQRLLRGNPLVRAGSASHHGPLFNAPFPSLCYLVRDQDEKTEPKGAKNHRIIGCCCGGSNPIHQPLLISRMSSLFGQNTGQGQQCFRLLLSDTLLSTQTCAVYPQTYARQQQHARPWQKKEGTKPQRRRVWNGFAGGGKDD